VLNENYTKTTVQNRLNFSFRQGNSKAIKARQNGELSIAESKCSKNFLKQAFGWDRRFCNAYFLRSKIEFG
jgi:hypothetical protein